MSLRTDIKRDVSGNRILQNRLNAGTTLSAGTQDSSVRWLERMLKMAGFNPGKVDASFSGATKAALRQFQAAWKLPVTGTLDQATFEKLKHTQQRIRTSQKKNKGKVDTFGIGQKHGAVKTAELRLRRLGYDVGKVNGIFDRTLNDAVKAFRRDQKELQNNTGLLSGAARRTLKKETRELNHDPYRVRAFENHKHRKRLDALTKRRAAAKDSEGRTGFGEGAVGKHVKVVQARLAHAGFDPKGVNGRFDERTEGALRAFQIQSGIKATGRVTPHTWKKLESTFIYAKSGFSPAQREGEKSAAVQRTEKLLRKLGYKKVKADGIFDGRTENAVERFEKRYRRPVNGSVSAADYRKMKAVLKARNEPKVQWGGGWAGSEGLSRAAKKIASKMGIPVTSTKRSAAGSIGSSTGSDHHVSQSNAYAVDFGVYGSKGTQLAKRIAKTYGLKAPYIGTYNNHYVRVDGRTYRVQLLWQVPGHYDHVHVGFRRVA